jgi:hypothetical protein
VDRIAERYVRLVLAIGQHDPAYVDAYFGPPEWLADITSRTPLDVLAEEAGSLLEELRADVADRAEADTDATMRRTFLRGQLLAVHARIEQLRGRRFTFDEESAALYDAVAPTRPDACFEGTLEALGRLLPGTGPLIDRLDAFRAAFIIPDARLAPVFDAAIAECRRQTRGRIELPVTESFTVEYVTDKPWSGYNWYKGGYRSVIQVNTDLPVYIDRAVDLAAHEGYPGHHLFNVLIEQRFVRERGWVEFAVYPLFSPQSLMAEGTANFGIDVAFPGDARVRFERDVLLPLAGLPAAEADRYDAVMRLTSRLSYAGNEAARRYLDGQWDRSMTSAWLTRFALMSRPRAEQRTRFIDAFRSYVINYNLGQDLVRAYIEARGGTAAEPDRRWQEFLTLLQSPRLPSGLR